MKSSTNRGGHNANPLFGAFVKALLSVMLLLVGNVAVKAQTEGSDFVFNDNVRYSQWVINSRLNDFYANDKPVGLAVYDEMGALVDERKDGGKTTVDYVPGLVAKGVIEAAQYYSAYPWAKPWFLSVAEYGNNFFNKVENGGGSLDNLNGIKLYITLSELTKTGGAFADNTAYTNANTAIGRAIEGLAAHNNNNSIKTGTLAGDAVVGGWFHKYNSTGKYNNQMWLDGQYMGTALLAQISKFNGKRTNISTSTDDFEIVYNQLKIVWDKCWNPTDKLMYHAFDANAGKESESHSETWAGLSSDEPYVFHSETYWARACGWYFLALVDVLEAMESVKDNAAYSAKYNEIKGWMTSLAEGLKARQDTEKTGGWYQILDENDSYSASTYNDGKSHTQTYNYIESSATAIFAAAYLKALNLGYLDEINYGETAKDAYKCIVNHFFASDGNGGVNIFGSCRSAGLGGYSSNSTTNTEYEVGNDRCRDGSKAYYLLGYDVARVAKSENVTEGKVLGAFILAATEYEKRYMKDKTVFLTKDLASSYTLGAGKSLTVGASGTGSVTYQWYKDGSIVEGATDASYVPAESGSYYCIISPAARAAGTIQSSTAEVTVAEGGTGTMLENLVSTAGVNGNKWTGTMTNGDIYATYTSDFSLSSGNISLDKKTSITLTIPNGYTVTSLKIKGASTGGSNKSPLTIGGDTYEYSGTTLTEHEFTIASGAGPITITMTAGNDRATRIAAIEVYGTKNGSTEPTTYTVTYNDNGHGTAPAAKSGVTSLTKAMLEETPGTVEGWTFEGWYTEAACTNVATPIATLTTDVELFAKWEKAASTGGDTMGYNFWFANAADATTNGVEQSSFFSGTPTGGSDLAGSITIGGKEYKVTKRSSSQNLNVSFTIDDGLTGKLYVLAKSGGSGARTLTLTKTGGNSDATKAANADLTEITYENLESGTYTLSSSQSICLSFLCMELVNSGSSKETTTTFEAAGSSLSADGKTLTITHDYTEAGQTGKTIKVAPAAKATYTLTPENDGAELSEGNRTITYTVPAANTTKTYKLNVTAEDEKTKDAYTIKIVTNAKPGSMAEYTGTFTLDQLKTFGSRSNDVSQITSDDDALTLTAFAGTTSGKNIEATGSDTGGAKMQTTSSFVLTSVEGVKIKKVSVTTTTMGRSLTATSTTASSSKGEQSASDNKIWEYTFNSIEEAITFKNENADNINVLRINVVYEKAVGDGKTALSAKFSKDVLEWYVNDAMPTEPTLTVTAAGTAFNDYSVEYTSSNTNVVTVAADGKLTLKEGTKGGTAVITAEVTPTDENYVGTSTVYTVNVKPLEVPTVYAHDITVYNTTDVQPQPVVDIYVTDAEGKRVILDKRYYELSYAKESGDDIIIGTDGQFVLAGEAGNWTTGSAVVRVTCKPTAEAAKLYHITEAAVTLEVHVVLAGDKLIPELGGVTEATMNAGTTRDFVKSVLYDGVDITSGFNCTYTITENGVTGSSVSKKSNGVLVLKAGTLATAGTPGTVTITVTATANEDYSSQYADITEVNNTIVVTVIDGKELQSVDITPKNIEAEVGDVLQDFVVVVKDENGNPVPEDDYTMVWGSSAPGVVAVVGDRSQGIFDAVSEGTAIVRVYIKKDGYAEMKGECEVTVEDPGMFKVTDGLEYAKGRPFDVDGLTLTLGGWMFKDGVAGSHGTTGEKLGEGDWGGTTTKYKKPLGFTHNIEMGTHKNARQEFGSNCQPESNYIYNAMIEKQDYELLDPMFNVPCSGSYLAFSPKTTGTVTVYIRQNGVFENNSGAHVYRPQRRVFVMDEKGQFVTSTPKLEYPTGWNDNNLGNDGTVFTCDILGISGEETKIYDIAKNDPNITGTTDKEKVQNWIMSHFYGLRNFNIDDFRNGVYASDLPIDITKNQAQSNHQTDLAARGWCVLTAAPVSYKFDVKPGKTYYLYNFGSKLGLYGFSFRKGSPTVDEQEWSENSTPAIVETEDNHVAKVSIDREFKTGIWNACVLPFSMNRQQVNAVFGDCYDKAHPDGTQILYFDRVEGGTIHFVRHAYNTIVAGKPFLIKPSKKDGAIKIASENMGDYPYVTIEKTAAENFGKNKETANYYWTSSYNSFGVAPGDYFLRDTEINGKQADGKIVRYPKTMTGELNMGGFRGYLTAKTNDLRQSAKSLTIAISDIENDETTYIENVEIADDGTLRQRINGKVYNLQGQLVSDDASQLDSLPKGIYIVNGKKVSVK